MASEKELRADWETFKKQNGLLCFTGKPKYVPEREFSMSPYLQVDFPTLGKWSKESMMETLKKTVECKTLFTTADLEKMVEKIRRGKTARASIGLELQGGVARLSLKFNGKRLRFIPQGSVYQRLFSSPLPCFTALPREGHVVYKLDWDLVSYVGKHQCKPNDRYVASGVLVILMWCARGPPTRTILHHFDDKKASEALERATLRAVDRTTRSVSWLNINFFDGATTTTTNPTDPTLRPLTAFFPQQQGPGPPPPI